MKKKAEEWEKKVAEKAERQRNWQRREMKSKRMASTSAPVPKRRQE